MRAAHEDVARARVLGDDTRERVHVHAARLRGVHRHGADECELLLRLGTQLILSARAQLAALRSWMWLGLGGCCARLGCGVGISAGCARLC